ncbi:MAG TPA: hypothetical protein VM734_09020 [Kofleriaceae bacterium]|jgi:hypothetical protein|nr:hypothetical protein [Kofleriaceae bacterium]
MEQRPGLVLVVLAVTAATGCAGALGVYVPGSGNKSGDFQTATPIGGGLAKVETHHYSIGDNGFGLALGAKVGRSWASMGDVDLAPGLAGEFHADFGYSRGRWGGLLSVGFNVDRGTTADDTEAQFGGLATGVIGQAIIIPRIAVHAGLHRFVWSGVGVGEERVDASGWKLAAGVDLTAYRGDKNEFIFRVDARHQRSDDAVLGGVDVSWSGNALLGEIVWVSTP